MAEAPRRDLEDRTYRFARDVREFVKQLPQTILNAEDVRQLVRSSGSVGANYIESQEALSRKDFRMRVRIARKEAKESPYWLRLLNCGPEESIRRMCDRLTQEASELVNILSAIINKVS